VPKTLVVLCLTAVCAATPGAASARIKAEAGVDPIVERINEVRRSHGLPPFVASASLSHSATDYSHRLMRANRFTHDSFIHASSRFGHLGEALAYHGGWRPKRAQTVRRWLRSTAHRALVLSRSFRYVGAGIARGRFGRSAATIWTLQLGGR